MWWWRKVRRANINNDLRNTFEQFGETVVAMSLSTGITRDRSGPIGILNTKWQEALAWLTERRDIQQRKEDRLETVEWAILLFVAFSFLTDIGILIYRYFDP